MTPVRRYRYRLLVGLYANLTLLGVLSAGIALPSWWI